MEEEKLQEYKDRILEEVIGSKLINRQLPKLPIDYITFTVANFKCYQNQSFKIPLVSKIYSAPNGTGKSSMVEAIQWCLTGIVPEGLKGSKNLSSITKHPLDTEETVVSIYSPSGTIVRSFPPMNGKEFPLAKYLFLTSGLFELSNRTNELMKFIKDLVVPSEISYYPEAIALCRDRRNVAENNIEKAAAKLQQVTNVTNGIKPLQDLQDEKTRLINARSESIRRIEQKHLRINTRWVKATQLKELLKALDKEEKILNHDFCPLCKRPFETDGSRKKGLDIIATNKIRAAKELEQRKEQIENYKQELVTVVAEADSLLRQLTIVEQQIEATKAADNLEVYKDALSSFQEAAVIYRSLEEFLSEEYRRVNSEFIQTVVSEIDMILKQLFGGTVAVALSNNKFSYSLQEETIVAGSFSKAEKKLIDLAVTIPFIMKLSPPFVMLDDVDSIDTARLIQFFDVITNIYSVPIIMFVKDADSRFTDFKTLLV